MSLKKRESRQRGGEEKPDHDSLHANNGDLIIVKYKVKNYAIAVFDYRIRIQKSICINPGCILDLFESNYSYFRFIPSSGELPPACIPLRSIEKWPILFVQKYHGKLRDLVGLLLVNLAMSHNQGDKEVSPSKT